jgi:hypothetical protein
VRLQDLFFILPQCVDLGLLSIAAAFRAARDSQKILGSRFEMIRIVQCESPRVFRVYDEEKANWRSIDDHKRGELQYHPEASRVGI